MGAQPCRATTRIKLKQKVMMMRCCFLFLYLLIFASAFSVTWAQEDTIPVPAVPALSAPILPTDAIPLELLDSLEGRRTVFEAVVDIFKEQYWDADYTDWDVWADEYRARALTAEGRFAFEQVMFAMVKALNDDHSRWIGHVASSEFDLEPRDAHDLPLAMGFSYRNLSDYGVLILRVYADSPAQRAGLRRGDVITAIDGQSLLQQNFSALQEHIKPREGIRILRVQRQREQLELPLEAAPLDMAYLEPLPTGYMLEPTIGYFSLPSFYHPEIAKRSHIIVNSLQAQGAQKLIIDMRDNTGGELGQLGLVLGIFLAAKDMPWSTSLSRGEVVWQAHYQANATDARHWLETPEGNTLSRSRLNTKPAHFTGDIAIIINRQNSSAGEIMPLTLQHYRNAPIIGEDTLGNTETVRAFDLPDGSTVLVAVSQLYIADEMAGVVQVDKESLETFRELARGFDAPVAEALKFLKTTDFVPGRYF